MTVGRDPEMIPELYALIREYEAAIQVSCDPEEQCRLRRILHELRACVMELENIA